MIAAVNNAAGLVTAAAADTVQKIDAPTVDLRAVLPVLIVLGGACLGVLVEAVFQRRTRYPVQLFVTLATLVAAAVAVVWGAVDRHYAVTFAGSIAVDQASYVSWGVILVLAVLSVLLIADRVSEPGGAIVAQAAVRVGSKQEAAAARRVLPMHTEVFPLTLFAIGGMLVFPAASDLLTLFVALEVLSLPLYLMSGMARRRRLISQEAAVKYFLLGAFASAIMLYGIALLYGYAGGIGFSDIRRVAQLGTGSDVLLLAGIALLFVGLLFKASVGPFHLWTPDVYQGAPTPVTAFMAACTKAAAFAAMMRILIVALEPMTWTWRPVLWWVAIASMAIGAIMGITQTDFKRMLAYSSIAHAGFLLLGVMAVSDKGASATLFYLLTYGVATIGAFAILTIVRRASPGADPDGPGGVGPEAGSVADWAGLAKRSPLLAASMSLFLLSFAGIPLTSGFIGKLSVFSAAAAEGMGALVVVAMVATAITAFFYLRIVVLMYFSDPPSGTVTLPSGAAGGDGSGAAGESAAGVLTATRTQARTVVIAPGALTAAVITVCVILTLALGIVPSWGLDLTEITSGFLY
ncbi:NADH-quinone oxidoreductase subunit NuoN [Nakamurella aerolata]|uniref:NADH-quinone oxidoreductase subunit N n=1 Tax=Nakamurella aerolata TaxID=1656892 RepID=A0A849A7J3_9ACTN|nr:NADH-quinone oxidoreductase subunit NuoN [Nakamurella aerolata]NNG35078.1 NADH-quinone oxidoreductase subunit NuoN [Nakamurella aerolata]